MEEGEQKGRKKCVSPPKRMSHSYVRDNDNLSLDFFSCVTKWHQESHQCFHRRRRPNDQRMTICQLVEEVVGVPELEGLFPPLELLLLFELLLLLLELLLLLVTLLLLLVEEMLEATAEATFELTTAAACATH